MSEEMRFDAQELVEVVKFSERTCSMEGCSRVPVATYSAVTPIEAAKVSYDVVWACSGHVADLQALAYDRWEEGAFITGWAQELGLTCGVGTCEGLATHVAFVARDYGATRRLEAVSLCADHAPQAPSHLGEG